MEGCSQAPGDAGIENLVLVVQPHTPNDSPDPGKILRLRSREDTFKEAYECFAWRVSAVLIEPSRMTDW